MSADRFCDAEGAPDMPFPICARHAISLYRYMHEMVTEVRTNYREHMDVHHAMLDEVHAQTNTAQHRVYYLRVGDMIKIGVTTQLDRRVASYPPGSELLAVERGGLDLEARRHAQFSHLLVGRKEWFRPGPDLLDHIAALAA
jgi:hypothetical protein